MNASSENILDDPIARLLLNGEAKNPSQAERLYLERNIHQVLELVRSPLTDEQFRNHPFIQLLFSHGSRAWEDALD
jgi:hypothetical protein